MTEFIGFFVVYTLAGIGLKHLHDHYRSTKEKVREAETVKQYTDQQSRKDQDTV